jgi:hypothetical protein
LLPSAKGNVVVIRALALLEEMYDWEALRGPRQVAADLDRELDKLVSALGEPLAEKVARTEAQSIAGKLVAIALDRRLRPERYELLALAYKRGDPTAQRDPIVPLMVVKKEHVRENLRMAWEYRLLIAPAIDEPLQGASDDPGLPGVRMSPTFEVIKRLKNDASLPSVVFFFRHICRDDRDGKSFAVQRGYALDVLESIRTAEALKAILDCAEWAESQWARSKPEEDTPGHSPNAARWIIDLISPNRLDNEIWRKLVKDLPEAGLSDRQRAMLGDAKALLK